VPEQAARHQPSASAWVVGEDGGDGPYPVAVVPEPGRDHAEVDHRVSGPVRVYSAVDEPRGEVGVADVWVETALVEAANRLEI
jgi:hypothetical protein